MMNACDIRIILVHLRKLIFVSKFVKTCQVISVNIDVCNFIGDLQTGMHLASRVLNL
jgi:hypothetical protein